MKLIESVIIQTTKHTIRITVIFCPQSLQQQKKMYFDKLLLKSTNKPRTTWNMVKTITNNGTTSSNEHQQYFN